MYDQQTRRPRAALVSMPWCSAWMPSVQLNVLRQCLDGRADHESFELFLDYAAAISPRLYRELSEAGGMIEEWVFAQNYFGAEGIEMPEGFLDEMPPIEFGDAAAQRRLVATLVPVTGDFLDRMATEIDWASFDVIAFSLSIYQTAPSMALAQRIRRLHPDVKIVFGGNSCAGPSGAAIMKICPHVDVVVTCEAELVFAALVEALHASAPLDDLPGLVVRDADGTPRATQPAGLHQPARTAAPPDYDAFFRRFAALGIDKPDKIWLPFESSRGCWWGEKSHCTFCGLHEIMKYRARPAEEVIAELDGLVERYGINRFFATDLILPNEYYTTFFPRLIETGRDFEFFYEVKGNVRRDRVKLLREAGVTNVQPGLESLSSEVLKLMRKGLSVLQGVQFLRWSEEFGIHVGWNVIVGMPQEDPEWNREAAERARHMHHLPPPHFIQFELNRFSPIFKAPEEFGLSDIAPLYLYDYVFPVDREILSDLVYRFEYNAPEFAGGRPPWLGGEAAPDYAADLGAAIEEWRAAYTSGAGLVAHLATDGGLLIEDSRDPAAPTHHDIPPAAARMYRELDQRWERAGILQHMETGFPDTVRAIGGRGQMEMWLDAWRAKGLVLTDGDDLVALATFADEAALTGMRPEAAAARRRVSAVPLPVAKVAGAEAAARQPSASAREVALLRTPDAGEVFAKRAGPGDAAADWEAEVCMLLARVCRSAGVPPLAPRFLGRDPERGHCYEAVGGAGTWHAALLEGDGFGAGTPGRVAAALSRLHALGDALAEDDRRTLAEGGPGPEARFRDYAAPDVRAFARSPGFDYPRFLTLAQPAAAEIGALADGWRATVPIHGDAKPDNILLDPDGAVRLVDWEHAGLGDPAHDVGLALGGMVSAWIESARSETATTLAALFASAPVPSLTLGRALSEFLDGYGPAADAAFRDRAWRYAGLHMLELGYVANATLGRMSLHCQLAAELGARLLRAPALIQQVFAGIGTGRPECTAAQPS